jgi:hypothetical protein
VIDPQDGFGLVRSWLRHRAYLREALAKVTRDLDRRANEHDLSKLLDDEVEGFSRINAAARVNKFGSPEYDEGMRRERATIDLHFSRNTHHPEGRTQTWLDVVEMVCDWWAAWRGYDDNKRTWMETVRLNLVRRQDLIRGGSGERWLVFRVAEMLDKEA